MLLFCRLWQRNVINCVPHMLQYLTNNNKLLLDHCFLASSFPLANWETTQFNKINSNQDIMVFLVRRKNWSIHSKNSHSREPAKCTLTWHWVQNRTLAHQHCILHTYHSPYIFTIKFNLCYKLQLTLGDPSLWIPTSFVAMPLTLPSSWYKTWPIRSTKIFSKIY